MAIPNPEFITEVLRLTNEFRATKGLAPLKLNPELNAAAQGHSEDMATRDYFSHYGSPEGSSDYTSRAKAVGYEATQVSENIAAFSWEPTLIETPAHAVRDWIDSDLHRPQLENPAFTELGVGVAYLADDKYNG